MAVQDDLLAAVDRAIKAMDAAAALLKAPPPAPDTALADASVEAIKELDAATADLTAVAAAR